MPTTIPIALALLSLASLTPEPEQAADENPVVTAADAFGTSIGGESIGLYTASNVRGFSPVVAGNARMEGLYFDQQAALTGRLVAGTDIRVGLATLGDPFPAPTGLVDVRIRRPGDAFTLRIAPQMNSRGGAQVEIDTQLPIQHQRFSLGGGLGIYEHRYPGGGDASVTSGAIIGRYRVEDRLEVVPFLSFTDTREMDVSPVIVPEEGQIPQRIPRSVDLGQDWAQLDRKRSNHGVITDAQLGEWTMRAGWFRSTENPTQSFSLQYRGARPDGTAELLAVATPENRFRSDSGEVRATRAFAALAAAHRIHLSMRAREQSRRYGGSDRIELGGVDLFHPTRFDRPAFEFGAMTNDEVSQRTASAAYEARWQGFAEFSAGLQKVDYRKAVTQPDGSLPVTEDSPWLYSGTLAVHVTPATALYGGVARGLEESPVAPEIALNRDEAPPALRTVQTDFGVRWEAPHDIRVVAGAFRIEKPYFAVDHQRHFGELGRQKRDGLELSLSGEPIPGLRIVAGGIWMDASVRGEAVDTGAVGARPIGSTRRTVMANLDYRFPTRPALSLDLAIEHAGPRIANLAGTLTLPAESTIDLGLRYRVQALGSNTVVRARVTNVLDEHSWVVVGNGAFRQNEPRLLSIRITGDF